MSKSVTLLFPGQGSQYVGMGKNLESEATSFAYFSKADNALGKSISTLCFEGPEDELKLTENTQPAILTHSLALFHKLKNILDSKNVHIDRVLGHSLGEYSALTAAGALSFEDAVKIVRLRGQFMQQAVPAGQGKMFAILKLSEEDVIEACEQSSTEDSLVMPANFNDPSQIVISGHAQACLKAVEFLKNKHGSAFRAVELPVSAPFHSKLMKKAADDLAVELKKLSFKNLQCPYIANIDAKEYAVTASAEVIQNNLIAQVCGSVLWTQSIKQLPSNTLCLEVGPGKVLAGLVKKINPEIKVISLDKDGAFTELEELLK